MTNTNRFVTLAGLLLALTAACTADSFLVTLDTTPLAGAQTLGFALTNANTAANTISLGAFTFGGGSATSGTDDCTFLGASGTGCSGDLVTGVSLQDLDTLVAFSQQFTPGSSLSFILTTTNNFGSGSPDTFAMYLCDDTVSTCYSDDAATASMLYLELSGGTLTPASFAVFGAAEQGLDAPVVSDAVPEPSGLVFLAAALALALIAKHRSAKPGASIG